MRAILRLTGRDESLIRYVTDRPGHDRRYAMNSRKIREELGWRPRHASRRGWPRPSPGTATNGAWCERVRSGAYRDYYEQQYARAPAPASTSDE